MIRLSINRLVFNDLHEIDEFILNAAYKYFNE